jgi:hypothetical protein
MSIFAMRVERTDDRPHIWPGSESRSNYSQTAPVTAKPLFFSSKANTVANNEDP